MGAYVLKTWRVSNEADSQGNYIDIAGRAPGLLSWILSLAGIEPTVRFSVSMDSVSYQQGSWSGTHRRLIPIRSISSIYHGFTRPWKEALALFGVGFFLIGTFVVGMEANPGILVFLYPMLLALVFLYYVLNRRMSIGVVEKGSIVSGVDFKRSVIEGKKLTAADAGQVIAILEALLTNQQTA